MLILQWETSSSGYIPTRVVPRGHLLPQPAPSLPPPAGTLNLLRLQTWPREHIGWPMNRKTTACTFRFFLELARTAINQILSAPCPVLLVVALAVQDQDIGDFMAQLRVLPLSLPTHQAVV